MISHRFRGFRIFLKIVGLIYVTAVDARRKTSFRESPTRRRNRPKGRNDVGGGRQNIKPTLHPRSIRDNFVYIYIYMYLLIYDSAFCRLNSSLSPSLSHLILFVSFAVFSTSTAEINHKVTHWDLKSHGNAQQRSHVHSKRIIFRDS